MRPSAFDYLTPTSLDEAIGCLSEHAPEARLLAGGQSLIPAMNLRLARPRVLVDLSGISGLAGIEEDGGSVTIGAMTTHSEIAVSDVLQRMVPPLPAMARRIGHHAIRNRGTIGGSLAHADPASEWPCALLALGGQIKVSGPKGERAIPAEEFFRTYYTTEIEPDEILTGVVLSVFDRSRRWSFHEVARQPGAFALVLVLACASLSAGNTVADLRLAVGGCGGRPVLPVTDWSFLTGVRPSAELIETAAQRAAGALDPPGDNSASGEDRRQMALVLLRRALGEVLIEEMGASV
jgi:CO/xanthine dehydrogenase FAD-binding subunit